MDSALRRRVRERAHDRCEYCRILQSSDPFLRFHVEHIIPLQHGGLDTPDNLALACAYCNRHKGPNLAAFDPTSGRLVAVCHPRQQLWSEHFILVDGIVAGQTDVGGATAELLRMNDPRRVELRVGYNGTL